MNYQSLTTDELIKQAQHLQNRPNVRMTPLFAEVLNRLNQHYDSQVLIGSLQERIEELEEEVLEYRQKIETFKIQQEALLTDLD